MASENDVEHISELVGRFNAASESNIYCHLVGSAAAPPAFEVRDPTRPRPTPRVSGEATRQIGDSRMFPKYSVLNVSFFFLSFLFCVHFSCF